MDWLDRTWQAIEENLRWADVIDIGMVAVFVYFVLSWLSARSSRGILAGVLIVGACYVLTDWLDLYLTRILFQTGFIFLLLSIIVVLQGDIRRGFEKLASLKLQRHKPATGPNPQMVRDLTQTVLKMSEDHVGALIIFPGREPVERFTRGGIRVDGYVSPAPVHSIFSPNSPGHDGAIIIRDGRIEQIGLHLPLSAHLEAIGPGGTRHAAALGLAERCDALVLVVSEERGTISIASQGKLRTIEVVELETVVIEHHLARDAASLRPPSQRRFRRRLPLKLASLALAVALWSVFAFRVDSVRRNYVIPIEIRNLPSHLVVDQSSAAYARLLVSGTERVMSDMDTDSWIISFDLADAHAGQLLPLRTVDGIQSLPPELDILEIDPEQFTLHVEARSEPPVGQGLRTQPDA